MSSAISAQTVVVGVAGAPIAHSLSPLIFNAWLEASGIDACYLAFPVAEARFASLVEGLRGGAIRGLNVTAPFKQAALAAADQASAPAQAAGSANLLIFPQDGTVAADNTDGVGLLAALREQAPSFDVSAAPIAILGAGGAARGAAAALLAAGAPQIRLVNRSAERAASLAAALGDKARAFSLQSVAQAFAGAAAVINSTPASANIASRAPLAVLDSSAVVMDMAYRPVLTPFLREARARDLAIVDGLAMLIAQARPSFAAMFGCQPPAIDVRALALAASEGAA